MPPPSCTTFGLPLIELVTLLASDPLTVLAIGGLFSSDTSKP